MLPHDETCMSEMQKK